MTHITNQKILKSGNISSFFSKKILKPGQEEDMPKEIKKEMKKWEREEEEINLKDEDEDEREEGHKQEMMKRDTLLKQDLIVFYSLIIYMQGTL